MARTPVGKTSATSTTKRTASGPAKIRNPSLAMPNVNPPVAESAASHRVTQAELEAAQRQAPTGGMYSPDGEREAMASESPLSQMGRVDSPAPDEVLHGGIGDHQPGPAPNHRHPTDRFDHSEELSADEVVVALTEIEGAPEHETLEEAIERIRTTRKPLGTFSQKLAIEPLRGYHTHWFNDEGNRIAEALEGGWAFRQKNGKTIRRAVGAGRDKGVLWAYAMMLPEVIWREDMALKHQFAQERMDSIQKAPIRTPAGASADKSDSGKFYSPTEMVSVGKR